MPKRSDILRSHLEALDAWTKSDAFIGWKAARLEEARILNEQVAQVARDWSEVVDLRARRDNTLDIANNSFEDARQTLVEAIDQAVEEETQLATTSNV